MFLANEAIAAIVLTFIIGVVIYSFIEYEKIKKEFEEEFDENDDPPLK